MNCDMSIIVEGPNERGYCKRRCARPGCTKKTNWTPHEPEQIRFACLAWPGPWEWGTWLAVLLEAVWITKGRVSWLAIKLNLVEPNVNPNCPLGCDAREKWLNSLGGKTVMRWRAFKARFVKEPPSQ